MMIDYNANIDILINKTFVSESSDDCMYRVFRFEGLASETIFNEHYQFFQEYLDNNLSDYQDIKPTKIFYNSCDSINGWASKKGGIGIISINRGTIVKLKDLFDHDEGWFNRSYELKRIAIIQNQCDYPIWGLMHQTCLLYLFYHEAGHIIQNSSKLNFDIIEEVTESKSDYDKTSHVNEIDADNLAGIRLGKHILHYWRKFPSKIRTKDTLMTLISIVIAGIGIYRLKLFRYSGPFYYKDLKHPHIVIRIAGLITNIIDYTKHELSAKNEAIDEDLNETDGYRVALPIFKIVSNYVLGESALIKYSGIFLNEVQGIKDYYNELLEGMKIDPESAYNKTLKIS